MLKFNNKMIPDFVRVKSINIDTLPAVTSNVKTVAGGFGCISGKSTLGEKIITVSIVIVIPEGETLQSCGRIFAGWLKGDSFKASPLVILDDEEVYYMAKVNTSVSLSDLIFAGEGELEFVIPSGLSLSSTTHELEGTNTVTFSNNGTHTCLPTIKAVIGQAVESGTVLVTQVNTGDKIILDGTFNVGDEIEINCDKHLVKVNGIVSMSIVNLKTKFFDCVEGEHTISCSVASSLKVIFQDRYI